MNEPAHRVYLDLMLDEAGRALGMIDRESLSPTAGCCDRTFWAWKFVDFPRSRFQEALCFLSFLHGTDLQENPFFRSSCLLEWIGSGLRFWRSLQHADGSFDEAYPYERSFAATAFTSFYIAEALELLGEALPEDLRQATRSSLVHAGRWLLRNSESHGFLSNHRAAGAAALYHAYRASGDRTFRAGSTRILDEILRHQSAEGWYEEYGGADPGYQTHGSFYLARLWQLGGDERLGESLGRSFDFLGCFVHPDGSLGGEYASRNTKTYYPAAFEMLAGSHPAAAWIAETMRPSLLTGAAAGPRAVDRYNYFPCLNNLVFAYLAASGPDRDALDRREPSSQPDLVWFPQAGLARVRTARCEVVVGASKGGVLKVWDRSSRRLMASDCGYIGELADGRLVSTQQQDGSRAVEVSAERIQIEGGVFEVTRPTMSPLRFVAFRLLTLTLFRLPALGRWLKNRMVRILIYRKRELQVRFRRTIELDDRGVTIRDSISGRHADRIRDLRSEPVFTTIHMGSARYFVANELADTPGPGAEADAAEVSNLLSGAVRERRVELARLSSGGSPAC